MSIEPTSPRYEFAINLIDSCKLLLEQHSIENIEEKDHDKDLVTNLDKVLNTHIIREISNRFNDSIVGEEESKSGNKQNSWYIDPIDGTTNFIYRHREFAISIAFEGNEEKFGLVFDVKEDTLYHAHTNLGAFINGQPFTRPKTAAYGIIHINPSYLKEAKYEAFANRFKGVRYLEVCAIEIIRVAIGEASCFYRRDQQAWDYKAAVIFAEMVGLLVEVTENQTVLVGTKWNEVLEEINKHERKSVSGDL
ncbi:inositol monophosphatase family protein [Virgibacillus dokdonensis]|uniref:Inositol-1-monophosphatase n=1 Tax=Virgibacillus dokdonensis TaxID=302167 RepID=A0A2K9J2N6_9BACI|nr:inositol monophosphatase family protein [Virgibacillus dokdonensis]AUJ24281.1 Inositol-1-monophosphatase [Virgibacillus dokdonensis]